MVISYLFCVPELLLKQIIFSCHNRSGFHFDTLQLTSILKPLIFHPDLDAFIIRVAKTCFICSISQPKEVHNMVEAENPECLMIASAYLSESAHGLSKALIFIDSYTGNTIIYPFTSLQASTVIDHLHLYFHSHPIPSVIRSYLGADLDKGLDVSLATYNISLRTGNQHSRRSNCNAT